MHESEETSSRSPQRVPLRTAVRDISERLEMIRSNLSDLRVDTIGPVEEDDGACPVPRPDLDSQVFGLFPLICAIESELARIIDRVGLDVKNAPKPTSAKALPHR